MLKKKKKQNIYASQKVKTTFKKVKELLINWAKNIYKSFI